MKKIILSVTLIVMFLFTTIPQSVHAITGTEVTSKEIQKVYNTGVKEKKIDSSKVTYNSFLSMCQKDVVPAYMEYKKFDSETSFLEYCRADNYEQPVINAEDKPTSVSAMDSSGSNNGMLRTSAKKSYKMKAGDILVVYGYNPSGLFVGHAGVASSSKYIMEMPGSGKKASHTTKATFFKRNTKGGRYVYVYRIKKHPHYADDASTYAYKYMYKKDNPSYSIVGGMKDLYKKSPTYCSKYVYLAYYRGATKKSVKKFNKHHLVTPHGLPLDFAGTFKPSLIHVITKY